MILCQRLSEWSANAPELEEDIALTNIALDLIGQARSLYQYAGGLGQPPQTEDELAYLRDERDWKNVLLVETPNGNFADTMARQLFFDAWHLLFLRELEQSNDATLAAIAAKSVKEATYHLRHSSTWVTRLGDGTEESHQKMQAAIDNYWRYTGELFETDELDKQMTALGAGVDTASLAPEWNRMINTVLANATLQRPEDGYMATGGRQGLHTTDMGRLLSEMQFLHRSYPGCQW